jgi:hypothetical protein
MWSLSVPAANAQVELPSLNRPEPTPNIPDQKLDAAAAALGQVASLRENYQQRLDESPTSDLADEAKKAFVKAVTDQGLSIEEYTSILVVARNDPVVRKKILERVRLPDK